MKMWLLKKDARIQRYHVSDRAGYIKTDVRSRTGAWVWLKKPEMPKQIYRLSWVANMETHAGNQEVSAEYRVWIWLKHKPTIQDQVALSNQFDQLVDMWPPVGFDDDRIKDSKMLEGGETPIDGDEKDMRHFEPPQATTWQKTFEMVNGVWIENMLPLRPMMNVVYGYVNFNRMGVDWRSRERLR